MTDIALPLRAPEGETRHRWNAPIRRRDATQRVPAGTRLHGRVGPDRRLAASRRRSPQGARSLDDRETSLDRETSPGSETDPTPAHGRRARARNEPDVETPQPDVETRHRRRDAPIRQRDATHDVPAGTRLHGRVGPDRRLATSRRRSPQGARSLDDRETSPDDRESPLDDREISLAGNGYRTGSGLGCPRVRLDGSGGSHRREPVGRQTRRRSVADGGRTAGHPSPRPT